MKTLEPYDPGRNWAGNYEYKAKSVYRPTNVHEIRQLILDHDKIKAVGSRHCFNDIADSESIQISTVNFKEINIDQSAMTVTVGSGIRYGDLCPELDRQGFALHNLASLPHISVAGACATATHGSGINNRNLATAVAGIEFIAGTGDLISLDRARNKQELDGAIVNLGAIGVVTKITLDIQPKFAVRQNVFLDLSLKELTANFVEVMSSGYSVSVFTKWSGKIDQVWIKRLYAKLPESRELFASTAAIENVHPIGDLSAEHCTDQMGVPGTWFDRLPHFKMGFTPSSGEELQSEYFVPIEKAADVLLALDRIKDRISPHLIVSEIRVIAADELWLSPCYKRERVALHFTWKQDLEAVLKLLPVIEADLSPFGAVPHWGKLFTTSQSVLWDLYDRMGDFVSLAEKYDPRGRFRNDFLDRNIFGALQG